jgi:hypothetical protein
LGKLPHLTRIQHSPAIIKKQQVDVSDKDSTISNLYISQSFDYCTQCTVYPVINLSHSCIFLTFFSKRALVTKYMFTTCLPCLCVKRPLS